MGNARENLLQGTLDLLILKTLERRELHGYDVAERILAASDEVLQVEEGALYPALHRMQVRGWLAARWGTSENNRRAKYYRLTAAGKRQLAESRASWERVSLAVTKVLRTEG
ncbi:MAG: PadR family transcriptional regulator [Terriglobales bacterium]